MFYARHGLWDGGGPLFENQIQKNNNAAWKKIETKSTGEIEFIQNIKFSLFQ